MIYKINIYIKYTRGFITFSVNTFTIIIILKNKNLYLL